MIKLFLGNRSVVLFLLPFVIAIYVMLNTYSNYFTYSTVSNFGFWGTQKMPFSILTSQIIASFFILFNAVGINAIFNWNEFFGRNSFMPSLLYIILMSFYHSFYEIDGLLVAHSCIITTLFQLFKLRQNEEGRKLVFNSAFLIGVAATFHPPLLFIMPIVIFMIWTIRPVVLRELVLALLGFGIPMIYAGLYLLFTKVKINFQLLEVHENYNRHQFDFLVSSGIFLFSFFLSVISIQANIKKSSIRLKKLVQILWWLIFTSIALGLMDYFYFNQIERFNLLMIPLSFLLTFSFTHKTLFHVANGLFYSTLIYSFVKFFL
jgi:hypothetical protein